MSAGFVAVVIALAVPVAVADPPPLTMPPDITTAATSASGAVVPFTVTSDDPAATVSCDHASGSVFAIGTTTVTCTATDTALDVPTASATFLVTVADSTPPVLSVPGNQTAQTTSPDGTAVTFSATAVDDIDGSVATSCSPPSGANFQTGTTVVNCSASDSHGNTSTGSFSVTVTLTDTTPPVVSVPADITQEATSSAGASVSFSTSAHDNIDGTIPSICLPASGATFAIGATTVACHATDAHGNTGTSTFHVTIRDTTPPSVSVPADITREATSAAGVAVSFSASASDSVDGQLSPSCSPASGTTFAIASTTVTCRATDAHGNIGSASFTVKVGDTTSPTLHLPANMSLTTPDQGGAPATFTVTATDTVDGTVPASCSPSSGATFSVGSTTVNCQATDAHNNKSTGSFSVTVVFVDTTPPVVTVPADITQEATSSAGASVTFTTLAHDNIDGTIPSTCLPASGATFAIGTTIVTCHATDAHGNTGTSTFHVTIRDTTPPSVSVPADITAEATSAAGAAVSFSASAEDTVNGSVSPSCSPASGSTFAIASTTVTCRATDAPGNTGSATFHVTVVDTTGPSVTVPADLTREANGPSGALVTFTPSASDAVDGPLTPAVIVCLPASGSKFALGKTTVTCSASDSHGNSGHASFAVTVVDTTPPRLNVPVAITMTGQSALLANNSTIAAFLGSANATDLVDGTVTVTNDAPASFPIGKTNVTFTAIDKNGNKTVATSSVTVTLATVPPPPPPDTQPPAPVGKLAARASGGVVALTWVSPPGSDFDHVVVEQSSGGSPLSVAYTGSANSYTAKGLTNGVEYRFVVVSYDKTGNASAEAAIVATPAAPMLVQPKDGAVTTKPPTLTWRAVVGAAYYNVQLYRLPSSVHTTSGLLSGLKVLSVWPTTRTLRLSAKWVFSKKAYRLTPGTYRWYVWPGFGPRADVKYGPSLGQSTFVVRGR